MANTYTPLSAVSGGRTNLKFKVRVVHLWCIPDKFNQNEINFMNLLLVDEKGGKIHATVRKDLVQKIRKMVEQGCTYVLENVMVGFNQGDFKVTPHKYKLNLMFNSSFTKTNGDNIPLNSFEFMSFKDILDSTVEEKMTDVIGHVVEKDDLNHTEKNGIKRVLMDMTLEDLEHTQIHCSLWGNFAEKMDEYFKSHDMSTPVILILQLCKTKKYFGAMGVSNSFYGTNIIINGELPEVEEYKTRMNSGEIQLTQGVSQMSGPRSTTLTEELLSIKRMTIEDLIESKEACYGSVLATICEIDTGVSWYFRSCVKCHSMVTIEDGQLSCRKCDKCKNVVPRFKLHVIVMDDTGSTNFVLFDKVVTQLVGRSVEDLIDEKDKKNTNKDEHPKDFDVLLDKQVLFKVEVSEGNVSNRWINYSVKKATDDGDIIAKFNEKHGLMIAREIAACEGLGDDANKTSDNNDNNLNVAVLDCDYSSSNTDILETPITKPALKRSSPVDSVDAIDADNGQCSTNKKQAAVRVKIEPPEDK